MEIILCVALGLFVVITGVFFTVFTHKQFSEFKRNGGENK